MTACLNSYDFDLTHFLDTHSYATKDGNKAEATHHLLSFIRKAGWVLHKHWLTFSTLHPGIHIAMALRPCADFDDIRDAVENFTDALGTLGHTRGVNVVLHALCCWGTWGESSTAIRFWRAVVTGVFQACLVEWHVAVAGV
jgi:hypothetical protein